MTKYRDIELLKQYLKECKLSDNVVNSIIGYIPILDSNHRGSEIDLYLKEHTDIKNYMIIDDNTDFFVDQKPYFVKTNNSIGLSKSNIPKILNIYYNMWRKK